MRPRTTEASNIGAAHILRPLHEGLLFPAPAVACRPVAGQWKGVQPIPCSKVIIARRRHCSYAAAVASRRHTAHCMFRKLEYLAVYGRASMGVPVGELQSAIAPTTDYCLSHIYGDWASDTFFCHGQKRDYLSRASQRVRGATKNDVTRNPQHRDYITYCNAGIGVSSRGQGGIQNC